MNIKTKAAIYTLVLLLWASGIIGCIISYPEQSKLVLVPIMIIGGVCWIYKLIYYILESK